MKRSLHISVAIISLFALIGCKGSANGNASPQSKTGVSEPVNIEAVDSSDYKAQKEKLLQLTDSVKKAASDHKAPNQEELDSIKKHKTNTKKHTPPN